MIWKALRNNWSLAARRSIRAGLAMLVALSCPLAPALAQSSGEDADITGRWLFETKIYWADCRLTGELNLEPGDAEGVYVGELIAREKCEALRDETGAIIDNFEYYAEQSVIAERDGDRLVITSTLVHVVPSPDNYWPDNFTLTIVDRSLMNGDLISFNTAPAVFYRGDAPVA